MRIAMAWAITCLSTLAIAPSAQAADTAIERLVVPYAVGGVTDLYGRVLAERIGSNQKNTVIVDNRAGAGGAIGTAFVAKSPADGRTVLLGSVGTATNPAMIKDMPYEPKDIVAVAQVAVSPLILYVRDGLPADLPKLLEHAKKTPGGLSFANSGVGSSPNLAAALFARQAGIDATHVSYRGTSAAINDLLGGQVDAYFDTPQALPHVQAGRIKAIAVASADRLEQAPHLPTLGEVGVPDVHAASWWGIFVPASTPSNQIKALETQFRDVLADPSVQQRARDMGAIAVYRDQEGFKEFFNNEVKRWGDIIATEKLSSQ
jgi:tripartite-type tricarboxylate transporter receptor subunit TctC